MDNQIVNIVKFLVKETPVGHLKNLLDSLKIIVGFETVENEQVLSDIARYEEDHLKQFDFENDKILISKHTKVSEGCYVDQNKGLKLRVIPLSENIDKIEKLEKDDIKGDDFATCLFKSFSEYKTKNFKDENTAINVFKHPETNSYFLLLSSINCNLKNFWTGEWISVWEVKKESSNFILSGNVKLSTYYYEEGNVQFKLNKNYDNKVSVGENNESSAAEIIKSISRLENNVQLELDVIYDSLSDEYLKPLRRRMPITGQKMNWNLNQIAFSNK